MNQLVTYTEILRREGVLSDDEADRVSAYLLEAEERRKTRELEMVERAWEAAMANPSKPKR